MKSVVGSISIFGALLIGLFACTPLQTQGPPAAQAAVSVNITPHPENPGSAIPADFLGLAFDAPTLADGNKYFDTGNGQMVNLLQNLGQGVLCFGANGLDYTSWSRSPFQFFQGNHTVLSPGDLDRMFAFASKTGWKVILGLNLGSNNPQQAADEAEYAYRVGAGSILAFEIGNEPDLYYRNGLRKSAYSYNDYSSEFDTYFNEIRGRVPNAPVAGPVTTGKLSWFTSFVKEKGSNIIMSTNHYYPLDAGTGVRPGDLLYASVENLLSQRVRNFSSNLIQGFAGVARDANIPLRFDETNTSYPGKDGVGDVFGSALWAADYLFQLADNGVSGANFFGGFTCRGFNPVCHEKGLIFTSGQYRAQALYYGMLFFHNAARGRIVPVEYGTSANISIHAVLDTDGALRLSIINKETSQDLNAAVSGGSYTGASAQRLSAPSIHSNTGITFAGSSVKADGTWTPGPDETIIRDGSVFRVSVPAASAVLVTFK
ncbi:MAG: hypothetical protein A2Z02_06780 [Chloroflexi bacterium RBG_16_48_7]|nr:MAG: hypothetical protein A2Z02_06780 [Chloroflexi bacterium RBG_16_48_7]